MQREPLTLQKSISDPLVRALERLGQDTRLSEDGHEIRIPVPARDNMDMDMGLDPCPRRFADVRAHIERLRAINLSEDGHAACRQFHHLSPCQRIELLQVRFMIKWDYHYMPAGIGIAIEDHVSAPAAERDQVLYTIFQSLRATEHTPIFFIAFNIFHTPWGPEVIHRMAEL